MDNQYFTLEQAADYCGKAYETFRYYIKNKRAPEFSLIGKRKVFTKKALDAWMPEDKRKTRYAK